MSHADRLRAIAAELTQIAAELAPEAPAPAPVPAPEPAPAPPAPAPEPEPAPAPPAPAPAPEPAPPPAPEALPTIHREAVSLADLLVFNGFHAASRYERFQRFEVYATGTALLKFHRDDIAAGGAKRALEVGVYSLEIDGAQVAQIQSTGGMEGAFSVQVEAVAPGWRRLQVVSPAGNRSPSWFAHFGAAQGGMPACTNVYDLTHPTSSDHLWSMLPARYTPTPLPLAPRSFLPLVPGTLASKLHRRNLAPVRSGTIHGPNVIGDVWGTFSRQAYFDSDQRAEFPKLPLIDGPRGVARTQMATHLQFGRNGSVYFLDGWGFRKMSADGSIHTLAGWRHAAPPPNWESPATLELVGDWGGIKPGFHEPWGGAWIPHTLLIDESAPLIDGRPPHATGPVYLVADSQNNRVVSLTFSPTDHGVPAVCRDWIGTLADPWDIAMIGDEAFISERQANRIIAVNVHTKAVRVVLQGQSGLAIIDNVRRTKKIATLDAIRAEPCCLPEGLYAHDGWLYFGSMAQGQVRRVRPDGSGLEVVCAPTIDMNSNFVKLAVGPDGTVYTQTWSIANFGYPQAFRPDGTKWTYRSTGKVDAGAGGAWETLGYGSAVAVDGQRIVISNSNEGLVEISAALTTDISVSASLYLAGRDEYEALGYRLTHGEHGFGFLGFPLPWGVSDAIDYYLTTHGHER